MNFKKKLRKPSFKENQKSKWAAMRIKTSLQKIIHKIGEDTPPKSMLATSLVALGFFVAHLLLYGKDISALLAATFIFSLLTAMIFIEELVLKEVLQHKSAQAMVFFVLTVGGIFTHGMAEQEVYRIFGTIPKNLPNTVAALTLSIALEPLLGISTLMLIIVFSSALLVLMIFKRPPKWLIPIVGMLAGVMALWVVNSIYTREGLARKISYYFDFNDPLEECPEAKEKSIERLLILNKSTGSAIGFDKNQAILFSKQKPLELQAQSPKPILINCSNSKQKAQETPGSQ